MKREKTIKKEFSILKGLILKEIEVNHTENEIYFYTNYDRTFKMFHEYECCESVEIEDINGDLYNLIGNEIVLAEERSNICENPEFIKNIPEDQDSSFTWTFYEIATVKGSITIRWYGESNSYYSESVDFVEVI